VNNLLIRVQTPYYVAGCVATPLLSNPEGLNYRIFKTAPILNWCQNKLLCDLEKWIAQKGFTIEIYDVGE